MVGTSIIQKMRASSRWCRQAVARLCFPPSCLACGLFLDNAELLFCPDCLQKIRFIAPPFCLICGRPFAAGDNHLCGLCLKKPWHFRMARAIFLYDETVAKPLLSFKFRGRKAGLPTFQRLKEQSFCCRDLVRPDLIIPVPLHPKRLRSRGFNQALLLARRFFPEEGEKIVTGILQRRRDTPAQTGLDGAARRKNMRDAFVVDQRERVSGRAIILVDDVFTTGSTVNECARVLMAAGAARVDVLTLARVEK